MQRRALLLIAFTVILRMKQSLECEGKPPVVEDSVLIDDQGSTITMEKVKGLLKERGIFDEEREHLTTFQRKELKLLLESVEMMMTSRARQPSGAQSASVPLRLLRRALDKQLRGGLVSRDLYRKFRWDAEVQKNQQ